MYTFSSGVGRVFTWGYGASGQLANNENKGRWVESRGVVSNNLSA